MYTSKLSVSSILYHPPLYFYDQLDLFISEGYEIYIYDNTPNSEIKNNSYYGKKGVNIYGNGENVGIAFALNVICQQAYTDGFSHLLFLDQDTILSRKTIEYISNFYGNFISGKLSNYAVVCFSGEVSNFSGVSDVKFAINSGSLFDLKILKMNAWHNKKYFVDLVDYEYCIRARENNFRIGKVFNVIDFDHRSGQPDDEISFLGKSLLVRKYSTTRIVDCYSSCLKLSLYCIKNLLFKDLMFLFKSFIHYSFAQIVSRIK